MHKEKLITIICLIFLNIILANILLSNISVKVASVSTEKYPWYQIYPFEEKVQKEPKNIIDKYYSIFNDYKVKFEKELNENILWKMDIVEFNGLFEKIINKKFISGSDNVVALENGYLTYLYEDVPKEQLDANAKHVIETNNYLQEKNIDFLYVQLPHKINKYDVNNNLQGYKDYSNKNADEFLSILEKNNVETLDLRENMNDMFSNEEYLSLFYKTDHHWLPTTGLWALKEIGTKLNNEYNFDINIDTFNIENYDMKKYERIFLGSQGRKVTLGYIEPEDFELYTPKSQVNFHVFIPDMGVDKTGNLVDTFFDLSQISRVDYYRLNPYVVYGYGDQPFTKIDNLEKENGKKILIIKDSYSNCLLPFLSQEVNEITAIDWRLFNGSIKSYIEKENPDMVLMMYVPSAYTYEKKNMFYIR